MDTTEQRFDKTYWEQHWDRAGSGAAGSEAALPANPYLIGELDGLAPATALDAGCGAGAEAIWLATRGWQVTAADISQRALARAAHRAACAAPEATGRLTWVEADLATWSPDRDFDLVTTHYAHPAMPQLDFYERIGDWVAPGGTLLIVGHRHGEDHPHGHGHSEHGHSEHGHPEHGPPAEATATAAGIVARLDASRWEVVTADEPRRTVTGPGGREQTLDDVVVRAVRRPHASA